MNDQVDEVKSKVDIVSIIGEHIQLKKAGRNYRALCPFHGEKTPSFMVSPELQMFKCFGCGETGDVFTFLEKYEGMEFYEALKFLAEKAGVKLVSFRPGEESEKEKLFQINIWTNRFYSYFLLNHPAGKTALNYLTKDRGLKPETIKTFQLGYSPDVPHVLKKFLVDKKKYSIDDLQKVGLTYVKGGEVIDKFRGRIIFPLFDHRGNVVGFAGRILPTQANKDLAKYINSPETPIYHKSKVLFGLNLTKGDIKAKGEAIIVEGELDMISSWQAGANNVIAIKGSSLTEDQVKLISRFSKKIILALDSDFAGDVAARRGIVVAQKEGLEVKVAKLEGYKDPDDAARQDPDYYKKALNESVGVWDYIVDSVFSRNDPKTGEGKGKISAEIVPILHSIPDKIVQAHYIEIVARRLEVPASAVSEQVAEFQEKEEAQKEAVAIVNPFIKKEKSRRQLLEERLLTLAFQSDPARLFKPDIENLFSTPLANRIFQEYKKFQVEHKDFNISGFAEILPKELVEGFTEIALKDVEEVVEDEEKLNKEFTLVLRELEIVEIRHKLEELGVKIRKSENEGEVEKVKDFQEKFGELSTKLARLEEEENQVTMPAKGG